MPMTCSPKPGVNKYVISGMGVPMLMCDSRLRRSFRMSCSSIFTHEQLFEQPISISNQETHIDNLLRTVDDKLAITKYLPQRFPTTDIL
jgi:hypothetical protein